MAFNYTNVETFLLYKLTQDKYSDNTVINVVYIYISVQQLYLNLSEHYLAIVMRITFNVVLCTVLNMDYNILLCLLPNKQRYLFLHNMYLINTNMQTYFSI